MLSEGRGIIMLGISKIQETRIKKQVNDECWIGRKEIKKKEVMNEYSPSADGRQLCSSLL
jgi:hypothetical protein